MDYCDIFSINGFSPSSDFFEALSLNRGHFDVNKPKIDNLPQPIFAAFQSCQPALLWGYLNWKF